MKRRKEEGKVQFKNELEDPANATIKGIMS